MRLRTFFLLVTALWAFASFAASQTQVAPSSQTNATEPYIAFARSDVAQSPIDRGGSAGLVWTDQGNVVHGPPISPTAVSLRSDPLLQEQIPALSCKGPAGP